MTLSNFFSCLFSLGTCLKRGRCFKNNFLVIIVLYFKSILNPPPLFFWANHVRHYYTWEGGIPVLVFWYPFRVVNFLNGSSFCLSIQVKSSQQWKLPMLSSHIWPLGMWSLCLRWRVGGDYVNLVFKFTTDLCRVHPSSGFIFKHNPLAQRQLYIIQETNIFLIF